MRVTSTRIGAASLVMAIGLGAAPIDAQTTEYPQLGEEEELRLAMSAGPLAVSTEADVYLMGTNGFDLAIRGSNGWSCLVARAAGNKTQLAPHCLDPHATETVLPAFIREARLQARGMDAEAIDAEMARLWGTGELALPSGPAFAYMLSAGQRLGPNAGPFRPHFMMYVPYVTNEAIGGDPSRMEFPFVGPYENHPLSTVVVLTEEFVSPSSVVIPKR